MTPQKIKITKSNFLKSNDGITLVEILVVLGIIALVAGFAAPQVFQYLSSSRIKAASIQLKNVQTALELYYVDVGEYPDPEIGLEALIKKPDSIDNWNGPYIKTNKGLDDPWGHQFQYDKSDDDNTITLSSLGRDGKIGGTGEDADIIE